MCAAAKNRMVENSAADSSFAANTSSFTSFEMPNALANIVGGAFGVVPHIIPSPSILNG